MRKTLSPGRTLSSFHPSETGRYFLVVKAISGEGYANLTFLPNLVAPTLNESALWPTTGDQSTQFNYSILYTDMDNSMPITINLSINGTHYPMQKVDVNDFNYTDGCLYNLSIYLKPSIYNYSYNY